MLISDLLACIETLSKGYVFRGQGHIAQAYLKDPANPSQKLILATTNAQVKALNAAVRERLKASGKLLGSWKLPDTGMELSLGDRLVFKERQELDAGSSAIRAGKASEIPLRVNLAKNEFATVMSVSRKADGSLDLLCQLDTPKDDGSPQVVRLNSRHLGEIDHAFATTVHRSQGMTVDSVFAVPGTFLSKELFYVMATRHRARLSIHMLESDRASILVKAGLNMDKLHGLDLVASVRAGSERAGSSWSLGIWERLQKSTDRLLALLREERSGFLAVMAQSHGNAARTAVAQEGNSRSRKTAATLGQILKTAISLGKSTADWNKVHPAQNGLQALEATRRLGSAQPTQHR